MARQQAPILNAEPSRSPQTTSLNSTGNDTERRLREQISALESVANSQQQQTEELRRQAMFSRSLAKAWADGSLDRIHLSKSFGVSPSLASFLSLTPAEAAAMGRVGQQVLKAVQDFESRNAKRQTHPDGSMTIDLPEFPPDVRAQLFDMMRSATLAAIGPERAELLGPEMESALAFTNIGWQTTFSISTEQGGEYFEVSFEPSVPFSSGQTYQSVEPVYANGTMTGTKTVERPMNFGKSSHKVRFDSSAMTKSEILTRYSHLVQVAEPQLRKK